MTRQIRLSLPLLTTIVWACGDALGPVERVTELPRELSVAEWRLIEADNRFAFKLFREIAAQESEGDNIFISPLSVAMALGMTYNGAAAETRTAMEQTLELEGLTVEEINASYQSLIELLAGLDPAVEWRLANSIWYRQDLPVRQEFVDVNREFFAAEIAALDFSSPDAAPTINGWVNDQTNGRIEEIVDDPIDPMLVMLLINAIYFKGSWTYQFDKSRTRDETFHLADGGRRTVPLMRYEDEAPVRAYVGPAFGVVELPYGGEAYAMTIILPRPEVHVDSVIATLDAVEWSAIAEGLTDDTTAVLLPKFTLEYDIELKDVLTALGMGVAFQPRTADLSGIALAPGDLFINKVKHKTFVDVNEEGTEAAAVTSVGIRVVCACDFTFRVDRPFIFAIRERLSGAILFMGRIMDPAGT